MMKKIIYLLFVMFVCSAAMADLAGYWPLDTLVDPNGQTVSDASGNDNDGVIYAADKSNYPQLVAGHDGTGGALEFNVDSTGSANCNHVIVDVNSIDPLANLGEAFTISMWARRDALGCDFGLGWPKLVYTNAYDVELALDPSSTNTSGLDPHDVFWPDLGGPWQMKIGLETAEQKVLGNWYHLAITCDGTVRKYVNGVEVFAVAAPEPYNLQATTNLIFGAAADGSAYLTGALDDIAIWAGSYLPETEVAKLANGTATPLTVVDELPLPQDYYTKETNNAWTASGWKALYNPGFSTRVYNPADDITVHSGNTASAWWIKDTEMSGWPSAVMHAGGHYALWGSMSGWYFKRLTPDENYYIAPDRNVDAHGISWIDPAWSGEADNIAKFAAYISSDIALCSKVDVYQSYNPNYSWELKDYFKTYARVAVANGGNGASLCVKSYSYADGTDAEDPANLTLLGEVYWPLTAGDYV